MLAIPEPRELGELPNSTQDCVKEPCRIVRPSSSSGLFGIEMSEAAKDSSESTDLDREDTHHTFSEGSSEIEWMKPLLYREEKFRHPLSEREIPSKFLDSGMEMMRITRHKKVMRLFKLDLDTDRMYWNSKASSFVQIEKIRSIRIGDNARNYMEEFRIPERFRHRWITVIYHNYKKSNNIKALHVIAKNEEDYDAFLYTLGNLFYFRRQLLSGLYSAVDNDLFTKFHWENKASDNGELAFEGVMKLATKLHINIEEDYLKKAFEAEDSRSKGYLNYEDFKRFVRNLRQRPEFVRIFEKHCSIGPEKRHQMIESDLIKFLQEEQHESCINRTVLHRAFELFSGDKQYMTAEDLGSFLLSPYSTLYKPVIEDFTRPLNEYFISSSHNTYLLGRQFNGVSSVEGYIHALERGCRCIEIDVWDGEAGPIVTHGRTFTGSIDFRSVVEAISKYSFITSPLPVILSLEIRCSMENQRICASILKDVLKDTLLSGRFPCNEDSLPSPLHLKHRILLKVKKSKTTCIPGGFMDSSGFSSQSQNSSSFSEDSTTLNLSAPGSISSSPLQTTTSSSSSSTQTIITKIIPKPKKTVPIIPELSSMAYYTLGQKFRNFSLPESKTFNHCFSFSDRTITKMLKEESKFNAIMKHNRSYLMRMYPSVYRFKSDNFNPIPFWALGCEFVATNWQIYDAGQQINEAMFNVGHNFGYVLKPKALRANKDQFRKPQDFRRALELNRTNYLNISIISAQQLPRPKGIKGSVAFDPYIEVELYSPRVISVEETDANRGRITIRASEQEDSSSQAILKLDTPSAVFSTCAVPRNGFNPVWDETFHLKYFNNDQDLVFLRFLIKCNTLDKKNVLLGSYCCKPEYLRQGYRHFPVYDLQGEKLVYSTIFLHINYGEL